MKLVSVLLTLVSYNFAQDCPTDQKQVICHWSSKSIYRPGAGHFGVDDIDLSLCTNVAFNFIGLNESLDLVHLDERADIQLGGFGNLTALKHTYPCLRTTLSIGGWDQGSTRFSSVASTDESREKFANQVYDFLVDYEFDAVDIDWEYPNFRGGVGDDKAHFPLLLEAVKNKISPRNYTLYATVAAQDMYRDKAYDMLAIGESVDFIQLMVYDSNLTSHEEIDESSAFIVARQSVEYWLREVPPEKLIIGLQAYARTYVLSDPEHHAIGDPSAGPGPSGPFTEEPGFLAYYEVLDVLAQGMKVIYLGSTIYAYNGTNWITYEDERSIGAKITYAMEQSLAGAMFKSIDYDDFDGLFGRKYPLLNAINDFIRNSTKLYEI